MIDFMALYENSKCAVEAEIIDIKQPNTRTITFFVWIGIKITFFCMWEKEKKSARFFDPLQSHFMPATKAIGIKLLHDICWLHKAQKYLLYVGLACRVTEVHIVYIHARTISTFGNSKNPWQIAFFLSPRLGFFEENLLTCHLVLYDKGKKLTRQCRDAFHLQLVSPSTGKGVKK